MVTSQWREVCKTAIHEKGLKNLFENYKPVSITSIICKLMESIVRQNCYPYEKEQSSFQNATWICAT